MKKQNIDEALSYLDRCMAEEIEEGNAVNIYMMRKILNILREGCDA